MAWWGYWPGFHPPLAEAEIPIFALSTFDTDYILVKRERVGVAKEALTSAGYTFDIGINEKKNYHLSVVGVILLVLVLVAAFSKRAPAHPYYADDLPYPLVIAHQGGDGLWPGDTMFAFEQAVALGVDVLEMDLHITQDGVLVISHDETVDRTTDGTGEIEKMTLAEIKALDAGHNWSADGGGTFPYRGQGISIPTLEEVFLAFPEYRMTIEIKKTERSMAQPFCDLIRRV